jgi:DNA helicase-2/ATP-dependent DNA helicase PcrA
LASKRELQIVDEELELCGRVQRALAAAAKRVSRGRAGGGGEFETLREELFEAREDDVGLVLALMHQQAARDGTAALGVLPELLAPYFAHLRVETERGVRDVLLGARSFPGLAKGLSIVSWRSAPITEVFFSCEPGDDYEIQAGDRTLEGVVLARRVVAFHGGQLVSVSTAGGNLVRDGTRWRFVRHQLTAPLSGAPDAPLTRQLIHSASDDGELGVAPELLDSSQQALLERDPQQPLLILGSAGCGKTTVALHRVRRLCTLGPKRFPAQRTLVVVPELGLGRLTERLLGELGLDRVRVHTFEQWVSGHARRLFPWLPKQQAPDTPPAVSKLKRHPGLLVAMDQLVQERSESVAAELDRTLHTGETIRRAMAEQGAPIVAHRVRAAERAVLSRLPKGKRKRAQDAFRGALRALEHVRDDFVRLVGDRELLATAIDHGAGALSAHHLEATIGHTARQLDDPAAVRYAHVDADRLATVDGRGVDEGTPDELAGTIDFEDYAIVLELLYRMTGKASVGARKVKRVAHLVVDEAQELAPIELRVLGRHVRGRDGAVTVAGDAAQQVDPASWFSSWSAALEALGIRRAASATLETTYRCPRPVAELAHQLLGSQAPRDMPRAPRPGPPITRSVVPNEGHAAALMCEALRDLGSAEPHASVAVIARHGPAARALHDVLSKGLDARLVLDGEFAFAPGVEVTEVAAVKGLEFDYVLVPDANAPTYPDEPEARRMLHVAVTRAAHQVWLVSPGTPSPILPAP